MRKPNRNNHNNSQLRRLWQMKLMKMMANAVDADDGQLRRWWQMKLMTVTARKVDDGNGKNDVRDDDGEMMLMPISIDGYLIFATIFEIVFYRGRIPGWSRIPIIWRDGIYRVLWSGNGITIMLPSKATDKFAMPPAPDSIVLDKIQRTKVIPPNITWDLNRSRNFGNLSYGSKISFNVNGLTHLHRC